MTTDGIGYEDKFDVGCRKDNGSNLNWTNAKAYCENYRAADTDWRMPTQTELSELHDAHKIYPSDCRGSFRRYMAALLCNRPYSP